ncbi:MAG: hypothetical protein IPM56_18295 [Ignavibacteriales bacterium]|nr:MAG: hypothetical protein IPM56_18295 [Ignavibacteriales bacterium]
MGYYISMLIILISLLFASCDNNQSDKWLKQKLEGDWIIPLDDHSSGFISFKDSLTIFFYESDCQPYYLNKDTIVIKDPGYQGYLKLPFLKVTDKYLWLKDSRLGESRPCPSTYNFYNKQLLLENVEVRFTDRGFHDYLSSTLYISDTKESYLKISYNKKVNFGIGKFFDKGEYFSKLNEKEFNSIQNKFRTIDVSELKNYYHSGFGSICGEPALIQILINYCYTYDDKIKTINIFSRGFEGMPIRLGILIKYLHQIYHFVKYEPTNNTHNFEIESQQKQFNRY